MRERRYHPDNETQHTPTNSFASDMQVEVSESSSPPLTVDGEEESSINDRDMDKKINSRIDETWGESSHLAEVDKNESSSREVHEVSVLDLIQVGFSRIKHKSAPVSLHLSPVKEAERDRVNPFSVSHSKIELMEKLVAHPSNNGDSEEAEIQDREGEQGNTKIVASTVLPELEAGEISTTSSSSISPNSVLQNKGTIDQASSSTINVGSHQASGVVQNNSSVTLPSEKITPAAPHNTPVLARDSTDQQSNNRDFENVQEFSKPPEKDNKETSSTYGGNNSEIPSTDIKNLKMTKDNQEIGKEQSKASEEKDLKSTDNIVGQFDKPAEENDNSKPFEDEKKEDGNLPKREENAENSTPVERNEIRESSENRVEEQGIQEAESSAISQSLNESIEHSISTNSVLSPKSVLNPKFSIDHSSPSSLGQDHVDEEQPHTDSVGNNSLNEILGENLGPVAPHNELRWTAESTAQPSNSTDFEKLQEPINPSITSCEEANNDDESSKHEEKGEEKMKSSEGDSQILSSLEATAELLKPFEDTDSTTIKQTEAMLDKIVQDIASAASSKPAEPSENSVTPLAKGEEQPSNPQQRSVKGEADKISNTNESSVANNMVAKDLQSTEESGDRNRGQANLTRQWWLTID